MCGIAGIWNSSIEQPGDRVADMLAAMQHRGPDGEGTVEFRGGAAGMVRLALVDLSERGQQPLWSDDRRVAIVFNGEIYNFRDERKRLLAKGCRFQSTTDTEVILNLYLEQGLKFVDRLRGMYALAILDWRESTPGGRPVLLLVRGPLGIKPLYVAQAERAPDSVVFSSEMRALLASNLAPREIDREGLAQYLTYGFLIQPQTMISGVRMLEPGTWERYAPGEPVQSQRFWRMPPACPRKETLDESAQRLRAVLDESVAIHAMADAPIGAFLSGGIDSTGIVGLMRKHVSDLRTYTLRFPDVPGHDEAHEAIEAARSFECANTVVDVTGREIAAILPVFAGALDQPSTDGLNTWIISRAAARDVKGVLSGVGGDEWFAGYPVTRRMANYATTFSGNLKKLAGTAADRLSEYVPEGHLRSRFENLATRRSALATWTQTHTVFRPAQSRAMAGLPGHRDNDSAISQLLERHGDRWQQESPLGLACLLDAEVYMACQLLRDSDATSMAHSLELRVPLVDVEVAAFSRSCAEEHKLHSDGGAGSAYAASGSKKVLIHALRDVLPGGIADRPKRGFALPLEHWAGNELFPLLEETCSEDAIASRGLLEPAQVAPIWLAAKSGTRGKLYPQIWGLMILELWCRAVLDAGRDAPEAVRSAATAG